jgi:uncharacterized protein with HEPN domain
MQSNSSSATSGGCQKANFLPVPWFKIEIVCEAARNVSTEFQDLHPKLPWAQTIDIHNKITGADFKLNIPAVWNTVQDDLPLLKQTIRKLLLA